MQNSTYATLYCLLICFLPGCSDSQRQAKVDQLNRDVDAFNKAEKALHQKVQQFIRKYPKLKPLTAQVYQVEAREIILEQSKLRKQLIELNTAEVELAASSSISNFAHKAAWSTVVHPALGIILMLIGFCCSTTRFLAWIENVALTASALAFCSGAALLGWLIFYYVVYPELSSDAYYSFLQLLGFGIISGYWWGKMTTEKSIERVTHSSLSHPRQPTHQPRVPLPTRLFFIVAGVSNR